MKKSLFFCCAGIGHSAVIIGNSQIGYFAFDNGGSGRGGYNAGVVFGNASLLKHRHPTVAEALKDLSGTRTGADAFDLAQKWETTLSQDIAAIVAAKGSVEKGYDSVFNNCMDTVDDALTAANVAFFPSDLEIPLTFFPNNYLFAIFIDYEDLRKGIIE